MDYNEYKNSFKVQYPKADNERMPLKMFKSRIIENNIHLQFYDTPDAWQRLFTDGQNIVWNDLRDKKLNKLIYQRR